jgi:predicted alpha/beta hydrolase family esterase
MQKARTTMTIRSNPADFAPLCLTVPGIDNSGPGHWQTLWEERRDDCVRVELGLWDRPHRNTWVNNLNAAIAAARRPVILVAHSLGCHAVAWWNAMERAADGKVVGALLVAPPKIEGLTADSRVESFAPLARERLRFPSLLAASRDDPYVSFKQASRMARAWGSRLVDVGWLGHVNARSGVGQWPFGEFLLERLIHSLRWSPVARSSFSPPRLPSSNEIALALY